MEENVSRYWSRAAEYRISRRRALRGAALTSAGLAGAALVGCGDEDEGEPAATQAPAEGTADGAGTGTGTAAAASQGKPGGRLSLAHRADPPTFDLHGSSTSDALTVTSLAYNQLVKMDPLVGVETPESVVPDLATDWEISPDGSTYTFHLVPNAKYTDGTPFTAADVKASYERQLNPPEGLINPPRGAQIQWIDTMDTPDDHTLVVNMKRPVSSLSVLPIFAQGWMIIYSKKDIDGGFDFKKEQNGTGPYRLADYTPGATLSYDRNPDYFVADRPYLDGVDFYITPQQSTQLANFQAGQLHVYSPDLESLNEIQKTLGDKVITQEGPSYGFSTMNYGGSEPWTDTRVRQALAMAMNKQAALDVLVFGAGRFGGYMSGGGYWSISEEELATVPGYEPWDDANITEARKMLDAAGIPAQMDTTILTRQNQSSENLSLYFKDQLIKIGINASLDIQETAAAYDILAKRTFNLAPWGHAYAVDDPDAVFAEFYTQKAPRNYSQVGTQEIDDLFLKQSMEQDPETRRELVRELQLVALPEHGKTILYWSNGRDTHWKSVKDYVRHTSGYNNERWQDVWLDA